MEWTLRRGAVYLNLNQRKSLPPEYEAVFKRDYTKYLNNLEDIVQNYQDVFFYGYFTIVNDKDGPEILQILKDLHANRTEVLSISFKDKTPFDVVAENKKMQDTIVLVMKTIIEYYKEMAEDYEEHEYSLTRNARWKGQGNYEICGIKISDWLCKEVVEGAAIYALLRPHNRSYTIYFLSVLIGQFSEAFWDHSTYNVIAKSLFSQFLQKTGSRLDEEEMKSSIYRDRIPDPAIQYCPWYLHFALMIYCLTYIDKRKFIEEIVRIKQSIYGVIFKMLALEYWTIIDFTGRIMRLGC